MEIKRKLFISPEMAKNYLHFYKMFDSMFLLSKSFNWTASRAPNTRVLFILTNFKNGSWPKILLLWLSLHRVRHGSGVDLTITPDEVRWESNTFSLLRQQVPMGYFPLSCNWVWVVRCPYDGNFQCLSRIFVYSEALERELQLSVLLTAFSKIVEVKVC